MNVSLLKTSLIIGFLIISTIPAAVRTSPILEEIPIIIDTDVAPDDVGAILYLLKHPKISVRAITVSCGVTYVKTGVNSILQLLDYLGIRDIPVAAGKDTPLYTNHSVPTQWRETSAGFYGLDLPQTNLQPPEMNATELIISTINASTENITIVTLGPLTNIAMAFQAEPSIKDRIELIDIMGGAVNVAGNVGSESPIPNYEAEWNIYIDPHAADIIFKSGVPIMLVPLDATNEVPQTEDFQMELKNVMTTPEAIIVHTFTTPGLYFWDQLAAVALTDPSVVTLETYSIEIELDNESQIGRTKPVEEGQPNAQVAVDADASKFEDLFIEIINQDDTPNTTTEASSQSATTPGFTYALLLLVMLPVVLVIQRRKKD